MRVFVTISLLFVSGLLQSSVLHSNLLGFIENKGQIIDQNNHLNPAVKYLFNGNGLNVQLRANGFSYDTYLVKKVARPKGSEALPTSGKFQTPDSNDVYHFHRIDIEFIGAYPNPQIKAEQPSTYYCNYYTTGTPDEGVTDVRTYQKVTYINLYEGIDLEFDISPCSSTKERGVGPTIASSSPLGRLGGVKYNFIIHPGADASQIKWEYKGAFSTSLQDHKIILSVESGNLEEQIPSSFISETSEIVNANYISAGCNAFSFSIPAYNKHSTLVIDPVPWATYFGGTGADYGYAISVDTGNNVISTGYTSSTSAIATSGAFQAIYGGGIYDAFIFKQNVSGACQWATYYGGGNDDYSYAIATDVSGNILIVGGTYSTSGIASAIAYQTVLGGGADAFVAKFSPSGGRIWGTYFGTDLFDGAYAICMDTSGGFYIAGTTTSGALATGGAYSTSYGGGGGDAFVARFNASGVRIWTTLYGGNGGENGFGICIDMLGSVLVTGSTAGVSTTTAIASSGAYQTSCGGATDAFIVKFNSTGTTRLWGTYFGGSGDDYGQSITTDADSNVIVTGYTGSSSGISTANGYQTTWGGNDDGFLAKFTPGGNILWSSYIGGGGFDRSYGVTLDTSQNILICGRSGSTSNISTPGAYQSSFAGCTSAPITCGDAIIQKYTPSGYKVWGSYFGGSGNDYGFSIALNQNQEIFITGWTASTTGIATTGAYQTTNGATSTSNPYDAFVAAFTPGGGLPVKLITFTAVQQNDQVQLNWQTASELNNDKFEVERSVNGSTFIRIGTVKGNGTSNVMNNYRFTDPLEALDRQWSTVYYRLKQIDVDGNTEYSNIVSITNNNNLVDNDIILFPNPAATIVNIQTSSNEQIHIQLFDVTGKLLIEDYFIHQTALNIQHIPKGLYFIRCSSDNMVVNKKIVIE